MEESQGLDTLMPRAGGGGSYLMVLVEGDAATAAATAEGQQAAAGGRFSQPPAASGTFSQQQRPAAGGAGKGALAVGVVAVDAASGDVVVGTASSGVMAQSGLEAALLALQPAEVIALGTMSPETARLLERFAGSGGSSRGGGGVSTNEPRVSRLVRLAGDSYLSNAALARLSEFYGGDDGSGGGKDGDDSKLEMSQQQGGASGSVEGGAAGAEGEADGSGGALSYVLALPPLVLQALSGAVDYLTQFGLAGALRDVASFRALAGTEGLEVSANAMQQLELMTTCGWGWWLCGG
jgi:hypothetical protein